MNKTKIEWCDYTWNPITGCLNGCSYCYARKIAMRFEGHFRPMFHPERLKNPMEVKKSSRIFADSMSDFWGRGVPQEWRDMAYDMMKSTPQHTYFLLTKQPQRIRDMKRIPDNVWVGVSITCFEERTRIAILISKRIKRTFVSLEPLLDHAVSDYIYLADWIIIGFLTGGKNAYKPPKETIMGIIRDCKRLRIPLFIKNNVNWKEKIQQLSSGGEVPTILGSREDGRSFCRKCTLIKELWGKPIDGTRCKHEEWKPKPDKKEAK